MMGPIERAIRSGVVPGVIGTIMRTSLFCALASPASKALASTEDLSKMERRVFMIFLSVDLAGLLFQGFNNFRRIGG